MSAIFSSSSNIIGNYVTEVAASFLFGLGYYLFKGNKQDSKSSNEANKISEKDQLNYLKTKLEENLKKFESIKSIEEFNKILQKHSDNFNSQEILRVITAKGLSANIETFNNLLISSFYHKKFEDAFILKNEILDPAGPVMPNSQTLNIIIKGFGLYYKNLKKYEINIDHNELCSDYDMQIQKVIQNFWERGIKPEINTMNYILEILYVQGRLREMWNFYEKFIEKKNNFNNNNLKNNKSENENEDLNEDIINVENSEKSEKISDLDIPKIDADYYTYILLLKSVKNLFANDVKMNAKIENYKEKNINTLYSKRIVTVANLLLNLKNFKMEESIYDTIIELCIRFDRIEEAEFYFKNLLQEFNFDLREYSFCLMIKAYAKINQLDKCLEIFNFLKMKKKSNFENNNIKSEFSNLKINVSESSNAPYKDNMNEEGNFKNCDSYLSFDDSKSTISTKSSMTSFSDKFNNPYPSTISYSSIMNACIRCNDIKKCEEFAKEMEKFNIQKNAFVYSIMINGYRKSKQYSKAINLFENLVNFLNMKNFAYQLTLNNKNINKENDFMNDLGLNNKQKLENKNQETKEKFDNECIITEKENGKEKDEEKINIVLFNNILDCCIDCEYFEKMEEIFNFLLKYSEQKETNIYNISPDLITYSTLMKGYAKANNVNKVLEIYEFLNKKKDEFKLDAFTYNIILDSMARNKDYEGMIKIYTDMKNRGIQTSVITYGILIKFYVNVNDLENTLELFEDLMNKGLKPTIIIYQLMIKLYSKNNMSYKCIDIFKNMILMGLSPDLMIINTILRVAYDNLYMKEGLEILLNSLNKKITLEDEYYHYLIEYLIYAEEIELQNEIRFNNIDNGFNDREKLTFEERVKGVKDIKFGLDNLNISLPKNVLMEVNKFLNQNKFKNLQANINNKTYDNNLNKDSKYNKFDQNDHHYNKYNNVNQRNFEENKSNYYKSDKKIKSLNHQNNYKNNDYSDSDNTSTISQQLLINGNIKDLNYEFEMDLQNNTKNFYYLEEKNKMNNDSNSKSFNNNNNKVNHYTNQSSYNNTYNNNNYKKNYNSNQRNFNNNNKNKKNNSKFDNNQNKSIYDF